ncbi:MAG: putative transcriptional regulatory protein, partial [Phycisphaerales bacterium]|nr:putative transcriptional regulatory protein [Phycisphaerales bacterium]
MGRQWLHAKRVVAGAKKAKANTKLLRDVALAAKGGGADPAMNARLFVAVEKAKRESVPKDAIGRAINKGAGVGGDRLVLEHVVYEGRAPHNVPVIVEVYTDNPQRTAPEIRVLFRKGQLATAGANKFVFDHVGLVEAHRPAGAGGPAGGGPAGGGGVDLEEA